MNQDGAITRGEWHAWLQRTHEEKGTKGDRWLSSVLHTLSRRLREEITKLELQAVTSVSRQIEEERDFAAQDLPQPYGTVAEANAAFRQMEEEYFVTS